MIKLQRRSALRARASVLAVMAGLSLNAQLVQIAQAAGPFTVNTSQCNLNIINDGAVAMNGAGRSVDITNAGTLGSANYSGLYVENSTLSGSIVNNGQLIVGAVGPCPTGNTSNGTPAAVDLLSSHIRGGFFNNATISATPSGDGVRATGAFDPSISDPKSRRFMTFGESINSPSTVVFENDWSIIAHDNAISLLSASVFGTISNTGLLGGHYGSGLRLENVLVTGDVLNSDKIKSDLGDGVTVIDTDINGKFENSANSEIHGGTSSGGAGVLIGGDTTISGGLVNKGLIDGDDGLRFVGSSYHGGVSNESGAITGADTGIDISTSAFSGGIANTGFGTITGENSYGILVNDEGRTTSFYGDIANDANAVIKGALGGIRIDTETLNTEFKNDGLIEITESEMVLALDSGPQAATWFNADTHDGSYVNNGTIDGRSLSGAAGLMIVGGTVNSPVTNNEGAFIYGGDNAPGIFIGADEVYGAVTNNGFASGSTALHIGSNPFVPNLLALGGANMSADVNNGGTLSGSAFGAKLSFDTFSGSFGNTGTIGGETGVDLRAVTWDGDFTNDGTINGGVHIGGTGSEFFVLTAPPPPAGLIWTGNFENKETLNDGLTIDADELHINFTNTSEGTINSGTVINANKWAKEPGPVAEFLNEGAMNGGVNVNVGELVVNFTNNAQIAGGMGIAANTWDGNFTVGTNGSITNGDGVGLQIGSLVSATESSGSSGLIWNGNFESHGNISGTDAHGASVNLDSFSGSFVNFGTIKSNSGSTSTGLTITANTWTGDFTNKSGAEISGPETGMYFSADVVTGNFKNEGTISGGGLDTGWNIAVNTFNGDIDNVGTLTALSNAFHLQINQLNGSISNSDLIEATASNGVGALFEGNGSGSVYTGAFTNTGTVKGGTSGTGLKLLADLQGGIENQGTFRGGTALDFSNAAAGVAFTQTGANALVDGAMRLNNGYTDVVTFKNGALKGTIHGGSDGDDEVIVDVASNDSFYFTSDVSDLGSFTAKSGATLLGTEFAGSNGAGIELTTTALTIKNGAELYLDDSTVVTTDGLDIESGAKLTYFLTTNVNQHGVIDVGGVSNLSVADPQSFSTLALTGQANLNGTVQAYLDDYDAFRTSGQSQYLYTGVITASNGVNGVFSGQAFAGNVPLGFQYTLSAIYNNTTPDSVDLLLTRTAFRDLIEDPNSNQEEVGDALDDLCEDAPAGSDAADFCNFVGTLGEDEIPDAYDDVSGYQQALIGGIGLDLNELLTLQTNENNIHGSVNGSCNQASIGSWCGRQYAQLDNATATDATSETDPFAWLKTGKRDPGKTSLWGRYVGNWRDVDGDNNAGGLQSRTHGAATGIDHVFQEDLLVGIAGLYSETRTDFQGRPADDADITTYQAGVYTSWGDTNFYVNSNATLVWNEFDTRRRIQTGPNTFEFADGSFDGFGGSAYVEVGKLWETEGVRFQPILSLFYLTHTTDAFQETGLTGGLNLIVQDSTTDSLRSSVGARVAYPFSLGGTRVVPEVRASWRHEFLDVQQSINAAFEGNPNTPLNIVGTQTGRDMAVLGMGVTANLSRDTVVYADVDGAFNADKTSATLALGLRKTW